MINVGHSNTKEKEVKMRKVFHSLSFFLLSFFSMSNGKEKATRKIDWKMVLHTIQRYQLSPPQ
jgi:hypothetical protein